MISSTVNDATQANDAHANDATQANGATRANHVNDATQANDAHANDATQAMWFDFFFIRFNHLNYHIN
jgi:hypothetical protein